MTRFRYSLTIATVFQNEAPYLKEWIEFHRMMGVDHFILVDDRSEDDYRSVLQPYVSSGEVELVSAPCPRRLRGRNWLEYQRAVLQALCEQMRGVSKWLVLIDTDEFIVPSPGTTVRGYLNRHQRSGAVYVRWEPFGTGYVPKLRRDELLTERMKLKWRFTAGHDMLGKSIVRPERVRRCDIHRCELVPGARYVDSNPGMQNPNADLKIHHYWSRDERFLLDVKLPRTARIKGWRLDEERVAFFRDLFNDVRDDSMKRFLPELRRRVFGSESTGSKRARDARPRRALERTRAFRSR